jgi:NAD+ diphosphatase
MSEFLLSSPSVSDWRFASAMDAPPVCSDPTCWFLVQGDKLVVHRRGETVELPTGADPHAWGLPITQTHYLGKLRYAGHAVDCFTAQLDAAAPLGEAWLAENLRQLYGPLGDMWFQVAGRALQIVDWDRTHRFCGRCGHGMEPTPHERAKKCPQCGLSSYPRISPAIIVAVTREVNGVMELLLARNHRFPAGRYSILAGFVEPGESLEECVVREVAEEVGVRVDHIRYVASQPWPFPNSLMLGFTAAYAGGEITLEEAEIADAQWFRADNLPQLPPRPSIARRLIDAFIAEHGPHAQPQTWG